MWLFGDSFDHYAIANIEQKWTIHLGTTGNPSGTTATLANGRRSTNGYEISLSNGPTNAGQTRSLLKTLAPATDTAIWGHSFEANAVGTVNTNEVSSQMISWLGLLGTRQIWFRLNSDTTISAIRNSASGTGSVIRSE